MTSISVQLLFLRCCIWSSHFRAYRDCSLSSIFPPSAKSDSDAIIHLHHLYQQYCCCNQSNTFDFKYLIISRNSLVYFLHQLRFFTADFCFQNSQAHLQVYTVLYMPYLISIAIVFGSLHSVLIVSLSSNLLFLLHGMDSPVLSTYLFPL